MSKHLEKKKTKQNLYNVIKLVLIKREKINRLASWDIATAEANRRWTR